MKYYLLNNGNKIPALGFGTYTITDEPTLRKVLLQCANSNYELIDTAYVYGNEHIIGKILKKENLLDTFQIATKIWPAEFGREETKRAVERSLKLLKRDYIDIMYLHWPGDDMEKSWKVLENYYEQGIFKNIGVSNFYENHIDKILTTANIVPQINQVEIHPMLQKTQLLKYLKSKNIQPMAWSPLAKADLELFENKTIAALANKYKKSVAQIILSWHISRNTAIIPRTTKEKRVAENIDIFNFNLSTEDLREIEKLDIGKHTSQSPVDEKWLKSIRYEDFI
ncbi:aldo/keto reductase [Anaerosphaera multitolerans]|nr:aldo/keto reductase [Anaerosphaera multitolerans]